MKKTILLLALAALSFAGYAQKALSNEYAYTVSEPYRVIDADEKWYFTKNNQVMTMKFDGKKVYIQKFDGDKPAFIGEQKYEGFFPKNYVIENIKEVNDKFFVFYSSWDGDNKKEQLFATEVDFAKGEFKGSPQMVMTVDGKVSGSYSGRMMDFQVRDKFEILTSFDKKAIMVKYRRVPEVKRDVKSYDIIGLGAFTADLKTIKVKEYTMPYTERQMDNLDYQIDNKGNLYILAKVHHDNTDDDKKSRKDEVANFRIELFTIKAGNDKINISKVDNKDKFISRLWIFDAPDSKGGLIAGGFYSNGKGKNWESSSDGVVTFKMKEDGSIADNYYYDIPVELLNEYESARTQRKNDKKEEKGEGAKFADLRLKNLKVLEDGSIIMVGEQDFIRTHTVMTGGTMGGTRTTITYHYYDMLVTKINADGKLGWMRKVPKQQIGSKGLGGMSYKFFNTSTDCFLVFLDNVKNFDLPLDKEPYKHSDGQGGYLTAARINIKDGTVSKGSILNSREVDDFKLHQFSTKRIAQLSDNSFVLEAYKKGKEDIMIKVVLK